MTARRLPLAVAALALLGATACEKPAPQITVSSGGRVINVDASRYCFKACRDHTPGAKSIRVRTNTTVAFDVPKSVAHRGWIVALGQNPLFPAPRHESHYTFTMPNYEDQPVPVTIIETGNGAGQRPTGGWQLQIDING